MVCIKRLCMRVIVAAARCQICPQADAKDAAHGAASMITLGSYVVTESYLMHGSHLEDLKKALPWPQT